MICPSCGCDNKADVVYCDDCGALLQGADSTVASLTEGPLEPGLTLEGSGKITRVVHFDGASGLYELDNDGAKGLVIEYPGSSDLAETLWELLRNVEATALWRPLALVAEEGRTLLVGDWPGEPLRAWMAREQANLTPTDIANMGISLLEGLQTLHDAGLAHRGISPDSVWIRCQPNDEGEDTYTLQLVRFERVVPEAQPCQMYSVVEGYSAPEAYGMLSGVVDRRSDIYGVGALLYALVALAGGEWKAFSERDSFFQFPPLHLPGAGALCRVLAQAVRREPEARFAGCADMIASLRDFTRFGDVSPDMHPLNPSEENLATADFVGEVGDGAGAAQVGDTRTRILGAMPGVASGVASGVAPAGAPRTWQHTPADGYVVAKESNVGAVRSINQDAFVELELTACERDVPVSVHFVAVIDGMGGEAEGDKAASLAARAVAHEMVERFMNISNGAETSLLIPQEPRERNAFIIERAMKRANRTIYDYACRDPRRKGMGCTMTCVLLSGEEATFGHVGDTRGYRIAGELDQVTTDHSVVGQLVQMGALTREEARTSPRRSLIYRALGTTPDVEVDTYQRRLASGEYVMLSSDGVWEYYTDEELLSFFSTGAAPADICARLISTTLRRGADDNTTVAVIYRV